MSPAPQVDPTVPVRAECAICARPLGPKSKRYHAACHRARAAARYSRPAARRRARAAISADLAGAR